MRWSAPGPIVLEEARDAGFASVRVVYRGADRSSVLTGRSDGSYHYRLRPLEGDGELATASVTVEHHALPRAFAFFGVGLVVFAATAALVARGAGDEEGEDVG